MGNTVIDTLLNRSSTKIYDGVPPTDAELEMILQSGLWAANGRGLQAPVMVVVKDKPMRDRLSVLNARVYGLEGDPFYGAPIVVAVLADTKVNTWVEDGSLLIGNMLAAASALGIGACWIHRAREVFDSDEGIKIKAKWGLSRDYRGVGFCILGHGTAQDKKPRRPGRIIYDK